MGFDNECIVNIQSLAGEYFCPVCRTLVYPNEALQSQCTHLYCKPCLIYVVGTTKACPYDGYLVTEADSKPLVESDKALADKIAKTQVHCLFHRSGCPWQGPLSECTSHCSGCTFGNSPVVCNRCGIQIVHRQVQEHAQNCAGANTQAQQTAEGSKDAGTTATATTANLSQASSQLVQPSQGPASQTTIASAPAHNTNSQVQANASAAGTTADQWYPQQFQQYYQQYPGYDPYQQAYMQLYPYQQQAGQALQQHAPHVVGQPQVYAQHPNAIQPHHQPLQQVQGQAQTQPQIQLQPQPLAQQQQPQNPSQGQPQAQSYAQNQVNPQQSHLVPQPHPQLQPAAQGQVPPQQPYPQAQPHLPPHSMQPPVQQNFQAPQYQQAQSQGHQAQLQMQPQPILQVQPQSHSLHPSQLNNPQSQQPAPHVGPGYHPPVQPQQQIPQAPPQQNSMQMHPISGSFPPTAQFPQQSPHMRPPQANASVPNQQSNLMPGHSQMQGVPLAQHQQLRPQNQQGPIGHQRPAVQPTQPPLQQYGQQSFPMQGSGSGQGPLHQLPFAQQSMHALSRPQGPTQFQHGGIAPPPPPPHSSMQAHGVPYQQPQPYGGRPVAPNQVGQPYLQSGGAYGVDAHSRPMPASSVQLSGHQIYEGGTSNQQQAPSGQQFSQSGPAVKHTMGEGNAAGQEVGSGPNRTTGKDVSGAGVDSVGDKTVESETGERNGDKDHRVMSEGESNGTHKEITGNVVDDEVDALKLGSSEKKTVNEEDANGNLDPLSGGDKIEAATVDEKDGNVAPKQLEYSSVTESTLKQSEAYVGHKKDDTTDMTQENNLSQEQVNPQGSAVNEYSGFQDKNSMNSSNPVPLADQGRHQMPPGPYGPSSHHQRPLVPSNLQSGPYPGAMPNTLLPGQGHTHLRPPGSGLSAPPRQSHYPSQPLPHSGSSHDIPVGGQPTPESVHPHESFEAVQSRQHYQNNPPHPQPVFSRTLNADPTGGPIPGPDGAAMHQNQRPHPFEGRYPDPHVSGPFDRGHFIANENHAPGYEGLHAKNVADDHRNPFLAGPPGREYDDASKQFPKPAIMGVDPSSNLGNGFSSRGGDYPPHEFNYDAPSRFLPPYHPSGVFHPNDIGERPTGFHEDHRARGYSARPQPDFHGSGSGFGPDHLPPRSPGREYHGIPSRGFGGLSVGPHIQSGLEDIHEGSRSSDIALDPAGKPFREHFRNGDMRGQDFIPNHMRRGELFGPRNGPNHFVGGDGFGPFPDPRMGDLTGQGVYPHNESFGGNKSNHLRLGEPGYRSSYSHHGFPSDGGFYAGNTDSFDRFRRRMPTSMGWCRICKVDCDTVDGLDLHSQTTEHQQRTMDMVISIKQQNSKRQKMSKDHTSTEDGSRARNPGNRGRGKKA